MLQIGWFSSGRDAAARALFKSIQEKIKSGYIKNSKVAFVFSNREPGEFKESDIFFELVKSYGVDLICFSHRKFKPEMRKQGLEETKVKGEESETLKNWRREYDREILKRIEKYSPNLIVLAGYMLIIGDELCKKYIMINLHPAPPGGPKGTWQEVIWSLIKNKAKKAGATIHLVTEKLDEGPPITYFTIPIINDPYRDLWQEIRKKGFEKVFQEEGENNLLFKKIRVEEEKREIPLLIETIKMIAEGKVKIENGEVFFKGRKTKGICLNKKIEKVLEKERFN
jgi:folate-dependent phosphoribosylglycinamide formyltransferase PurN